MNLMNNVQIIGEIDYPVFLIIDVETFFILIIVI